ncbi:hypothetical protein J4H92_10050 [Leucobacter weissii]|uniref:Uncharacterized protein n=1 Tax=Leucobacter weissii TaxID=1983706 RepID=A0A939MPM3_9MICO|nr:hypothetical protein [Leucobacter weissii]MBO1902286.1 hypothetical protein [Leucobacter weissii]
MSNEERPSTDDRTDPDTVPTAEAEELAQAPETTPLGASAAPGPDAATLPEPPEPPAPPAAEPNGAPSRREAAEVAPHEGRRTRTGPIVWGAIILAFCAYVAAQTLAPGSVDPVAFVIACALGLGALLLLVGIAVLVRNRR